MEVVFSDSAKAGLTWAARRKMHSTMKIGSVAGLSFLLDVGDISGEVIGEARTQAIWNLYGSAFDSRKDASFRNFIRGIADDLKRVCDAAKRGEAIRIWHSDAPQDACGLRHLLWDIRDCECPVCEVVLPRRAVRAASELGVGDGWYAGRIRRMIDRGEIEAVRPGEADYPYSAWLRKTV